MPEHEAIVVENRVLTPVIRHVVFELQKPETFHFRAGQFIQFVLGPRILRHFSMASAPHDLPRMDLCVDISPGGHGSTFIAGLIPGQHVHFRGPFGVFVVPNTETRPLEFVATGAGIAPFRSMVYDILRIGDPTSSLTLTFGNRTPVDMLYHNEWQRLAEQHVTFHYVPTLSQPAEQWTGARGRVTTLLTERGAGLSGRVFFICGSPAMVDDTRKVLAAAGVPDADVHFEKFT